MCTAIAKSKHTFAAYIRSIIGDRHKSLYEPAHTKLTPASDLVKSVTVCYHVLHAWWESVTVQTPELCRYTDPKTYIEMSVKTFSFSARETRLHVGRRCPHSVWVCSRAQGPG